MTRLRLFFAILLFLFFFPLWRAMDFQVITFSSGILYTLGMAMIIFITILIPMRLSFPLIKKLYLAVGFVIILGLIYLGSPLSGKATRHSELRHCGLATFTGLFYPISSILPPAHQVDLEVRNQMCWIRKMALRVPESITDIKELQNYLELIRQKLLSPPVKYKASLPLIAFLHGRMSTSLEGPAMESVELGKMFVDSLHFWKEQYTTEISELEFPWYAWPHSAFIQFEYGLIEKNWENLVESIQVEN
jgi:uncharacterized protein YjeT (DUF2065 family)